MRLAVIILFFVTLASACTGERNKRVSGPTPLVAASAQTRIVLDVDAAAVVKRAYRQGPIEAPTVTHLPCKARPDAPLT
ncbi:MAG TPA: hypothetical protein VF701_08575, partial [Thermoanaerobaculia bacterium]